MPRSQGSRFAENSLFEGMGPETLGRVAKDCAWLTVQRNQQVLGPASDSKDLFLIVEGRVQVVNYSLSGREVAYESLGSGAYFGELSAIDGERRSAVVVALEKSLLAVITPTQLHELISDYPVLGLRLLKKLAHIIRQCDERIMDLTTRGAVQRVYIELLRLCRPSPVDPAGFLIMPAPTQAQIANRASTTRETVARVLKELSQAGLIERKGKTVLIRDKKRLETMAVRLADDGAAT